MNLEYIHKLLTIFNLKNFVIMWLNIGSNNINTNGLMHVDYHESWYKQDNHLNQSNVQKSMHLGLVLKLNNL